MRFIVFITFLVVFTSCDVFKSDLSSRVSPSLEVTFSTPKETTQKVFTNADTRITLTVTSASGTDFSPEVNTVLVQPSQTENHVAFNLSLFPDSVYTFHATYKQENRLIAEGASIFEVTENTKVIPINVMMLPEDNRPSIGFEPALVVQEADNTAPSLKMVLKFYGSTEPIKALAFEMKVSGIDTHLMSFKKPFTALWLTNRIDCAWEFSNSPSGSFIIDTLSVPLNAVRDIQLNFEQGRVQYLNTTNQSVPLFATGAHVQILEKN